MRKHGVTVSNFRTRKLNEHQKSPSQTSFYCTAHRDDSSHVYAKYKFIPQR